ncbi:hypothetical protein D3C80_1853130 [compost metagenome]
MVIRLAARSVPIPTMAWAKSATPSWRKTMMLVESAWTACVNRSAHACTGSASLSMPMTSWPRRISDWATELPKRPRPITTTLSPLEKANCSVNRNLANNWMLLWVTVGHAVLAQGQ